MFLFEEYLWWNLVQIPRREGLHSITISELFSPTRQFYNNVNEFGYSDIVPPIPSPNLLHKGPIEIIKIMIHYWD